MLIITFSNGEQHKTHIGVSCGFLEPNQVSEVQADGDELTRSLTITGRPEFRRVQKFYGDDAKMIVGNWE